MMESSTPLMRILALIAITAVFAGVWRNDSRAGAATTVAARPMFPEYPSAPRPQTDPATISRELRGHSENTAVLLRSISLDAKDLQLTQGEIEDHLRQLPLGLAPGSYRLVDPRGGMGWLHVTGESTLPAETVASEMETTVPAVSTLRWRAAETTAATLNDAVTR